MDADIADLVHLEIHPHVEPFFHADTNTIAYVVRDPNSAACAIVDPVLDFDYAAGRTDHVFAERIAAYVERHFLSVEWLIETHVHADHLSAAPYLQSRFGGRIGIGAEIVHVQRTFGDLFKEDTAFQRDGSQFDRLFCDGERYRVGAMSCVALHTPGHTPACMTHVMGDAGFVGDTLFMPDAGSARADFPGGDARTLYRSIRKILKLPAETRLFICHDYGLEGRDIRWETTVGEQRSKNVHAREGVSEAEFVAMRTERDRRLGMPQLIVPSLQVNMRAGNFPPADADGDVFLKVPLNKL